MSVYLDVSVLVALFAADAFNDKADRALETIHDSVAVSEFASTEFSSVISARVRTRDLRSDEANQIFSKFDAWTAANALRVDVIGADVANATTLVRRLDLSLRAPDALHIAIAQRVGSRLLTFDKGMVAAARGLGIQVVTT